MGFFDRFRKKRHTDAAVPSENTTDSCDSSLSQAARNWNALWDRWVYGRVASPVAELMTYDSEVNNGGHAQFFYNVANTGDLPATLSALYTILPPLLKENLETAYAAHIRLEEAVDEEESSEILEGCDAVFYTCESQVLAILQQYADAWQQQEKSSSL